MGLVFNVLKRRNGWDGLGQFASGACALHCALCALAPSLFTVLGMDLMLDHEAEWAFTILAIVFASGALVAGWMKHRAPRVAGLFILGIGLLLASRFLEEFGGHELGTFVGVVAGILLVVSHWKNSVAIRACDAECC